jgi:hypothetical protein
VVTIDEDARLGREHVKWRQAQIGYAVDRPDVAPVRIHVAIDVLDALTLAIEQLRDVEPAGAGDGERGDGRFEACRRRGADGASPPRAGTAGNVASSAIADAASSSWPLHVPAIALLKTFTNATERNDDAT